MYKISVRELKRAGVKFLYKKIRAFINHNDYNCQKDKLIYISISYFYIVIKFYILIVLLISKREEEDII